MPSFPLGIKGKKVLLSFYRYASCPFCNLRFHSLSKKQQEWRDKSLERVAVFQSPTSSILEYAGKDYSPVRIIPNPDRDIVCMVLKVHGKAF